MSGNAGFAAEILGFTWDRSAIPADIPARTVERAVYWYQRERPAFVWDAAVLEGNPFTFAEVQTLMSGVTVGGRKLSDERQVANLAETANELLDRVVNRTFRLDKPTSDHLQWLTARDEAFDAGKFRGEGEMTLTPSVSLGEHGRYTPPSTEPGGRNLRDLHTTGVEFITSQLDTPFEQGLAYFLFAALQQFYFDGNKRTGRFMMNGHLMMHGYDAISVPAARRQEFNQGMVAFHLTKDATDMFGFLTSCLPDVDD